MARKRSKQRRAERQRRQRKTLDSLIGRHIAEAVLSGMAAISDVVAELSGEDRGKAIALAKQLRGEAKQTC